MCVGEDVYGKTTVYFCFWKSAVVSKVKTKKTKKKRHEDAMGTFKV